jgi:hypothetical protein
MLWVVSADCLKIGDMVYYGHSVVQPPDNDLETAMKKIAGQWE